jgi:cAMP-dependent protein kinase regulator
MNRRKEFIAKQGEAIDTFYLVQSGSLDSYKEEDASNIIKTYQPGDCFGKLALLYNIKSDVNIKVTRNCILLQLSQTCFNLII